jgi:antitoxin ParD1/3/4
MTTEGRSKNGEVCHSKRGHQAGGVDLVLLARIELKASAAHRASPKILILFASNGIICQLLDRRKTMPTRNVVITDHQAAFIDRMVKVGRYQNASEVLREGLRAVEQREAENAARLKALRAAVQVGIDDIEAGKFTEFANADAWADDFRAEAAKIIAEEQTETAA